jgi:hypothetical protein
MLPNHFRSVSYGKRLVALNKTPYEAYVVQVGIVYFVFDSLKIWLIRSYFFLALKTLTLFKATTIAPAEEEYPNSLSNKNELFVIRSETVKLT